MLWACIALPALSLDVALRTQPDPARPVALIDGPASCRSLLAVNAAAARLGLRAGQKLTLARAIHADFSALPFDAVATARWQQWLAAWAYRFSHQVSVAWPHSIVLEVGHSLQLMGGWPAFEARLRDELGQLQFQHRIGLAPSPRAAHLLAWLKDGVQAHTPAQQQALLARVPVRRAGLPGQAGERLHRLGLRRLQQVFDLPPDTVRRRFGAELLQYLDELRGQRQTLLACYAPPDHFDMRIPLEYGVSSHQVLLFPLRRLVMDLSAFLQGRSQGTQQVLVRLEHEPDRAGAPDDTCLRLDLLAPEQSGDALFGLLRSRLEALPLPQPVVAVRLVVQALQPLRPRTQDLFEPRGSQPAESWARLRERLRVRLGEQAVYGVQPVADPRPERAWRQVMGADVREAHECTDGRLTATRRSAATRPELPSRPGWLLPAPLPLERPVAAIVRGPERLESGWWDGDDQKRDYYVLRLANGQLAWAFCPVGQQGPWTLQGWFA